MLRCIYIWWAESWGIKSCNDVNKVINIFVLLFLKLNLFCDHWEFFCFGGVPWLKNLRTSDLRTIKWQRTTTPFFSPHHLKACIIKAKNKKWWPVYFIRYAFIYLYVYNIPSIALHKIRYTYMCLQWTGLKHTGTLYSFTTQSLFEVVHFYYKITCSAYLKWIYCDAFPERNNNIKSLPVMSNKIGDTCRLILVP